MSARRDRSLVLATLFASCLVFAACGAGSSEARPAVDSPRASSEWTDRGSVPRYERFERVVATGDTVRAQWWTPSLERIETNGFHGKGGTHVRFAPQQIGKYRYELSVERGGRNDVVERGTFESVESSNPGAVHLDRRGPFRLSFADGTPFFMLGENRINIYDPTWNYGKKSVDEYVAYMADNGMTTLRVFIPSDCVAESQPNRARLGCLEPRLGEFDEDGAEIYDRILEAAENRGIYVVLTVNAIGFSPGDAWKGWEGNAYSRERGGTASSPNDVFTRADLARAAERKLDYVVARYGYSSHLLAIDLLNEPEWDGQIPETLWVPWAEAMTRHLRDVDPYGHLVTVGSVGLGWNVEGDERPLYASSGLDLVQWHLYGKDTYDPHRHALEMARRVEATYSYGKPVFCGEFAYGGEDPALFDHTHTGLWAAMFAGGGALAHSAPPFNLDSDEPMTPERANQFRVLSRFMHRLDMSRTLMPERFVGIPHDLHVWSLGRDDYKALWVLAPHASYGEPVSSAEITVRALANGRYRITWYDDVTGEETSAGTGEVRNGTLRLEVPPFRRHAAAVVAADR